MILRTFPLENYLEIHIVDETRYTGILRVLDSLVMLQNCCYQIGYVRSMHVTMSYMVALEK